MTETYSTNSPQETEALGRAFAARLRAGDVVAFFGGLGAGKTTFARGILNGLGYSQAGASPTFAVVNEYRGGALDVAHFDVYRITSEEALFSTGFYDYLDRHFVVLIEWSEHIPWALDGGEIRVTMAAGPAENQREITIFSSD